jgi:NagD protein
VLTGVATPAAADRFPYRPSRTIGSVAELIDEVRG